MTTSDPSPGERIVNVRVDEHTVSADLADGRTISAPLAWFPLVTPRGRVPTTWLRAAVQGHCHAPTAVARVSDAVLRGLGRSR